MNRCLCGCVVALLLMVGVVNGAVPADSNERARKEISFDPGWRFLKGDAPGAEKPDFKDSDWRQVDVPHDWSIEGPYDQANKTNRGGGYLPSGISWYRKSFTLPATDAGKRIFIQFDGVMANSEVWINGHSLGKRPNGYVTLYYELTKHLQFGDGKTNLLAVKTDTTQQPASRWYTGQGIYRHVKLLVKDPVHIDLYGTYVTSPTASVDGAVVKIQNTVVNTSDAAKQVTITSSLIGPDGKVVATTSSTGTSIDAGKSADVVQEVKFNSAKLWSIEEPNLYRVVSKVQLAGQTLDEEIVTTGIRSAEFKPESGFWLNGKNVKILGACLHSDGGAVGAAVPVRVWERRLELLKQIGVNGIRISHNPHAPEFMDLLDRMGFVVLNESFDTWLARKANADFGYQLYFKDWWEADSRDTVMRDRNHPGVVMFSLGNEIRDNLNSPAGQKMLTDQRDIVHKYAPGLPVTMGLFRPELNGAYVDMLDVAGFNYRPDMLPQAFRANPKRKTVDTEETHALDRWAAVRDAPSTAGLFVWTGVDYLGETGEANGWPFVVSSNANDGFGMMEHSGYFRAKAWQRQSWWSTKPMVKVVRNLGHGGTGPLVSDWTPLDPDTYDAARAEVYTNADEAELFLNDKSLGSKPANKDQSPLAWQFQYEPGTLKVVAKKAGAIVATDELKTATDATKLAISADRLKVANEFDDVSHIIAKVVDKNGVVNPNAEKKISFKITGPGRVAAVSTGKRDSHEPFQATDRTSYHGEVLAIVKSTENTGKITITATAEGLEPATITLDAAPPTAAK